MSNRFQIKPRKGDFNDAPIKIDVERSVLDVRKVYPDLPEEQFAKMYHRKYRIAGAVVMRILEQRDQIIEARKECTLLTDLEFTEMFTAKNPKVKKRLIAMVLEDYENEVSEGG
ncbi:hypothetical protein [Paenibacillus sp. Pae108]|uniref:hypothetical protein n=1 Tax=Paenibacillus sp. Pae108 TaxID=2926019 RepID=UPI002119AF4D|nr:hypothetical protein [Paenibacillus sp. Pae108]